MKILGIDHSTMCTGWGLINLAASEGSLSYEYLSHGYIDRRPDTKYPETIYYMVNGVRNKVAELVPDYIALEAPKDNRGFKATQILTELVGAIKYILMDAHYKFEEIPPATMKLCVTGYGFSTKEEVAMKVGEILNKPYESIVRAEYYKTEGKRDQVKKYTLDGSDALGLAIALPYYVRRQLQKK